MSVQATRKWLGNMLDWSNVLLICRKNWKLWDQHRRNEGGGAQLVHVSSFIDENLASVLVLLDSNRTHLSLGSLWNETIFLDQCLNTHLQQRIYQIYSNH